MQAVGGRQRLKTVPDVVPGRLLILWYAGDGENMPGIYSAGSAATEAVLPESRRTVSSTDS